MVLHFLPHPSPFSSSVHTWQLHQHPHPLPLLSRARQFDGRCPLFARNKNICSVKCFCKWLNGLMGCRATGVQVVQLVLADGLISVHSSDFSEKDISLTHDSWKHGGQQKLAQGSSSKPNSGPLARSASRLIPLNSPAYSLYQSCLDI